MIPWAERSVHQESDGRADEGVLSLVPANRVAGSLSVVDLRVPVGSCQKRVP